MLACFVRHLLDDHYYIYFGMSVYRNDRFGACGFDGSDGGHCFHLGWCIWDRVLFWQVVEAVIGTAYM